MTAPVGRPVNTSADLSEDDFDSLDDAGFRDFQEWDHRRTCGGAYHMGEYSIAKVFDRMRWIYCYCLRLRARLRESKNAVHIKELQRENSRQAIQIARASEMTTVEDVKGMRRELDAAREEIARNRRDMAHWQIAPRTKGRG